MTTIELPFELGVTIWAADTSSHPEWVECPECAGTRVLTLIQGNGEQVSIDCACCRNGYEPSTGRVQTTQWRAAPRPFTPRRFRMDGDEWMFSEESPEAVAYGCYRVDRLFKDRAACQAECDRMNAEHVKHMEESMLLNLMSKRRDMAWSVHYWGRQVKDLEKNLERAKARLQVCKTLKSPVGKGAKP